MSAYLGKNEMRSIVLFQRKSDCCGCGACLAVCKVNAIYITADEEGFLYPKIDGKQCVQCGRCVKVCPVKRQDDLAS